MREQHSVGLFRIGIFLIAISVSDLATSQEKSFQAWDTSREVAAVLWRVPTDLDPTLPAPRLVEEPEYTWGQENTVYWYGDSVRTKLSDMGMVLLFFEVQARFDETELWGFVDANVDSATFTDLPEGIPVEYRLRYFAQDTAGAYAMSLWSAPEISIQDVRSPVLLKWEILSLQSGESIDWVIGRTIQNRVEASDTSFGKVMAVAVHEKSDTIDDTLFYDLELPGNHVDFIFPYTMWSPEKEPATLHLWVVDVAGQQSEKVSTTLFWWSDEKEEEKMVCFPNPFNPEEGEISTIKVDDPDVKEARIFDPFGNLIRVLRKEVPSNFFFEWDGTNANGDFVSNGGYLCVAEGKTQLYCKIAVLR